MSIGSIISILVIIGVILYALWKRANLYLLLAVAIIMIFIICVVTSIVKPYVVYSEVFWELSFVPNDLTRAANLHTIITSMFVHANHFHLVFNLFALIFIGSVLEVRIGTYRLFALYFITGVIGTFTFAAFYLSSLVPVVGASGAIYGLLGALARLYPRMRFFGFIPAYILLMILLLIGIVFSLGDSNIAHLAHIGGAISGFFLAPLIARLGIKKAPTRVRIEGLEALATTPELRDIIERVKSEDDAMVRQAWLERFYNKVSCPNCNGMLKRKRNSFICESCGWKMKISD